MKRKKLIFWLLLIILIILILIFLWAGITGRVVKSVSDSTKLLWPVEYKAIHANSIFYPDVDGDGKGHNCKPVNYRSHEGTDIAILSSYQKTGVPVFAALEGQVLWVFNGKYDKCPNIRIADCNAPTKSDEPGLSSGYRVCTKLGPYCENGTGYCYWCFNGANIIVIRHYNNSKIFATRYDHLKNGSILVKPGDFVKKGQKIAEVGSAGYSLQPHLHFEVWGTKFYEPVDPWTGKCGPNYNNSLWESQLK